MSGPLTVHLQAPDGSTSSITIPQPAVAANLLVPSGKWPTVKYSALYKTGDADLMATVKRLSAASWLLLDRPGVFEFTDFAQARNSDFGYGLYHPLLQGLFGSTVNPGDTVVRMKAGSSTVKDVPAPGSGQTNGYFYSRVPHIGNLTLQGTIQGHLYNGQVFYGPNGSDPGDRFDPSMLLFDNLRVSGVPGAAPNNPPTETTHLSFLHMNGTPTVHYRAGGPHNEVTGVRDADGDVVGGSPVEWNYSTWLDVLGLNCHDTLSSMPTFDFCTDCTTTGLVSRNCGPTADSNGINHEQSDRITHNSPQLFPAAGLAQIAVNGSNADSTVTVNNPGFSGQFMWNKWSSTYGGQPNTVTGKNIHVTDAAGKPISVVQVSQ